MSCSRVSFWTLILEKERENKLRELARGVMRKLSKMQVLFVWLKWLVGNRSCVWIMDQYN